MSQQNSTTQLNLLCQKEYGRNFKHKVKKVVTKGDKTEVTVQIKLPDGRKYVATASNQKKARAHAAEQALKEF